MLLAQVFLIAFAVALLLRARPFAKAPAPVAAPADTEPDGRRDSRAESKVEAAAETVPIAGTASPWHFHLDRQQWPVVVGLAAGLLTLIPAASGLSLAMALRGLWGDPSITTVQLLALALIGRTPAAFATGWRAPAAIAAVAVLFYPLALGATDFDPYRLGYAPGLLLLPLALAAFVLGYRGRPLWAWLLAIDLLAWAAGLLESPNLWDTLLDPLLAVACAILAARNGWRTFRKAP